MTKKLKLKNIEEALIFFGTSVDTNGYSDELMTKFKEGIEEMLEESQQ